MSADSERDDRPPGPLCQENGAGLHFVGGPARSVRRKGKDSALFDLARELECCLHSAAAGGPANRLESEPPEDIVLDLAVSRKGDQRPVSAIPDVVRSDQRATVPDDQYRALAALNGLVVSGGVLLSLSQGGVESPCRQPGEESDEPYLPG